MSGSQMGLPAARFSKGWTSSRLPGLSAKVVKNSAEKTNQKQLSESRGPRKDLILLTSYAFILRTKTTGSQSVIRWCVGGTPEKF
jgi:hypothetical protein